VARFIDHVVIKVSDYEASRAFYLAALEPLGVIVHDIPPPPESWGRPSCAIGPPGNEDFCLDPPGDGPVTTPIHIAFAAPDRATVDAFYAAALAAGGRDNGAPGPRPIYHEHYYGAFVLDPDGHNVEAVCHKPAS
jgi:catechol 2,3-dioxygenase-like lactoylglutathione lyase family enzyme